MSLTDANRLLDRLDRGLDYLNRRFELMTVSRRVSLSRDIRYLLLDNIARCVRLTFYDPDDRATILFQFVYALEDNIQTPESIDISLNESPGYIAFDVFIEFTETFLSLNREDQELLINNTEITWQTYY
ncbi:MAG: hypothetical protein HQK57_04690 [Deltaproteobacteria bacterium]|nr:hypothetical protein [Deltaproteobacteria bacterium]